MKKQESKPTESYAAFLRGINVGGNKVIKMADVKKAFESMGFADVKTVGASGNILFSGEPMDAAKMAKRLEDGLREKLAATSSIIVRTREALRQMTAAEPFKKIKATADTRLYVTFFNTPPISKNKIAIPYRSPDKIFELLSLTGCELYSVVDLSTGGSTIDAMEIIEKEFGKSGTTRNWNTIQKLVEKE